MKLTTRLPIRNRGKLMRHVYVITFKRLQNKNAVCLNLRAYLQRVEKRPAWTVCPIKCEIRNAHGRVMATWDQMRMPDRAIKRLCKHSIHPVK
jgi:hypothetical protein